MQKHCMHYCLREKPDIRIRQQHTRVVELNDRLVMFPNGLISDDGILLSFSDDQKLEEDELTNILGVW